MELINMNESSELAAEGDATAIMAKGNCFWPCFYGCTIIPTWGDSAIAFGVLYLI
jgi:hypothetical protein